jgi:sn-glycerol 3-phosphate transport system substrate-binding protein
MRRSPRSLLILAVALVFALAIAACGGPSGGGDESDGGGGGEDSGGEDAAADLPECPVDALADADGVVEVTLWHAYVAKTEETLNALADEYNASQDKVHVNVESQGTSYRELQRKYNQAIPSNDLPGIAILEDIQNQSMADSGTVLPLTSCDEADDDFNTDDFLPIALDYYAIDDVVWPQSMNLSTPILYYNRKHFEQAGLDPDAPPTTLEEMREAAQAIQDAGVTDTPWVQVATSSFVESWMTGLGEELVNNGDGRDEPATEATLEGNEPLLDLFTFLKGMADDGLLNPLPDTDGQIDQYLALGTQSASFGIETTTAATSIEAFLKGDLDPSELSDDGRVSADVDLEGLDIAAAPLPGIEEPGRPQVGGGVYYVMSTTPPEVQAGAWDFMKFINTTQSQVTNDLQGSYLPLLQSAVDDPELQDTWQNTLSGQWLALGFNQLDTGVNPDFSGITLGPYTEFRKALQDALEGMYFNGSEPADVIATAQSDVDDAITQYEEENF